MQKLDPLYQFVVKPWIPLHLGSWNISLTNSAAFMIMAVVLVIAFFTITLRKQTIMPSAKQSLAEIVWDYVHTMLGDNTHGKGLGFMSLVLSIFCFVFAGNFLGLMPYSFTFTSQIIINFSLALFVIVIITGYGMYRHKTGFFRLFLPKDIPWWVAPILTPIEIISYASRPISLSVRLFANMVAGHSMLKIFGYFTVKIGVWGVLPFVVNVSLMSLEFMMAFLQAYVFTILSCIYINDVIELH